MSTQGNILEQIMAGRRDDVESAKQNVAVETLRSAAAARTHHSLIRQLQEVSGTRVIAEVKKASPSAGLLREDYDPAGLAREYEAYGAVGISVLTEPRHFMGHEEHLRQVRSNVSLPILRKDFICDVYQVYEAAAWGADVVLLIIAALDADILNDLYETAMACQLEVLAEAHNGAELEQALSMEKAIIGVNSRDLRTLQTNLSVARELAENIPSERISIAESGIKTRADIEDLENHGYNGFLVGESLLKGANPGQGLEMLLKSK